MSDPKANLQIEPVYNRISYYIEITKEYSVELNGRFGLIDQNLLLGIPPVADQPIFESGEHLIVKVGNELIYYDRDYIEVKRHPVNNSEQDSGLLYPADYPLHLGYSRKTVLGLFNENYGNKYEHGQFNVVAVNSTYSHIIDQGNIKGINTPEGKTLFLNQRLILTFW